MFYAPITNRITLMKERFVQGIESGMSPPQAATYAGSRDPVQYANLMLRQDEWVRGQMERIRAEANANSKVSREKVTQIVLDAVDMAKVMSSPGEMIRGAAELNKMNGYYAPDKVDIQVEARLKRVQTQYESMSDAELLEVMGEAVDPIEAEFRRLDGGDENE